MSESSIIRPVELLASSPRSRVILCAKTESEAVLLKALQLPLNDRATAERVAREVTLASRMLHPFIVASEGWFSAGREVYLSLEYLPGGDIDFLIDREGVLSPHAARFYVGCAALALEALHSFGYVHRDVKPDNLLIGADGYAKLSDLGFARVLLDGERAHTLLGTPEYLAPECFLGEGADARSDIWALGTSLYVMLTASYPWCGATPEDIYARVLEEPLFFPKNVFTFSEPVKAFLSACLRRKAEHRPAVAALWEFDVFAKPLPPTGTCPPLTRDEMLRKAVKPPFLPHLKGAFDTHYFAEAADSEEEECDEGSSHRGGQRGRLHYVATENPNGRTSLGTCTDQPQTDVKQQDAVMALASGAADPANFVMRACSVEELM